MTALAEVVTEPPVARPNARNLQVTRDWLADKLSVLKSLPQLQNPYPFQSPVRAAEFERSFIDVSVAESAFPSIFDGSWWTDDYPAVTVKVTLSDGSIREAFSNSQKSFMIPWVVKTASGSFPTYNARLSRAVAALMPPGGVNRSRLAGDRFEFTLAESVIRQVDDRFMAPAVALVKGRYLVKAASFYAGSGNSGGTASAPAKTEFLSLRLTGLGPLMNLEEWVDLPFLEGHVYGTENFLGNIGAFESRLLSLPWIKDLLDSGEERPILLYGQGGGLDQRDLTNFSSGMLKLGRGKLSEEVKAEREKVALIWLGDAYLLVLPDERTVLWRFGNVANRIKPLQLAEEAPTKDCGDYLPRPRCSGAIILPSGALEK